MQAMTNIERIECLLGEASVVVVDGGPLLQNWDWSAPVGDADNQVLRLRWTDVEGDFSAVLTEGGIAAGSFDEVGRFCCEDHEGAVTCLEFFRLSPIS